jgi:hypothetical protein
MRMTKLLTTFLLALALSGCLDDQNRDECSGDVKLLVRCTINGVERINDISTVGLFVFDEDNMPFSDHYLTPADFAGEGYRLTLPPGKYRLVSWANATDRSRFSPLIRGVSTLDRSYIEATSTRTGDALYYAPDQPNPYIPATRGGEAPQPITRADYSAYLLEVLPNQSVTKELDFVRAHRTINVYVKGIETLQTGTTSTVEAAGLWNKYNFLFETQDSRMDFAQPTVPVTTLDGPMQLATFHFAYGEIRNDITVTLKGAAGTILTPAINLHQYLLDYPAADRDDINILITFLSDLGMTITLPSWDAVTVTPGTE